jgi:methyltransferase family protein
VKWRRQKKDAGEQIKISIPEIWSDENGIALRGWVLTENGPPDELEVLLDGEPIPVVGWHDRHAVVEKYPEFNSGPRCGFWAYAPRAQAHKLLVRAKTGNRTKSKKWTVQAKATAPPAGESALFETFRQSANGGSLKVLEVGSRVVVPGSASRRALFSGARSYTGFDIYPDDNTDVVGDAHRLSAYFSEPFDAIFSLAVFEHLAAPWLVATEINRSLALGGLTFHQTHFAFPLHEQPADYWRFSEQGLRALFSPAFGFEVIASESTTPVRLHPADRSPHLLHLPSQPAFIHVSILAKKIHQLDATPTTDGNNRALADHAAANVPYPKPKSS